MEQSKFYQIKNITEHEYTLVGCDGSVITRPIQDVDKSASAFTIRDAKDGDVLCCENGWTCIFKTLVNYETFSSYCFMDKTKWFCETGSECQTLKEEFLKAYNGKIYPATKEQRDLLFRKMREAGYEWDEGKKELKETVTPIFNIGDTIIKKHNSDIHNFGSFTITDIAGEKYWYNDRIICDITKQDEWELYEPVRQTPAEWSEEDEELMKWSINNLTELKDRFGEEYGKVGDCINWLKSLKGRYTWKPTAEQMRVLDLAIRCGINRGTTEETTLVSLFNDLKKLK